MDMVHMVSVTDRYKDRTSIRFAHFDSAEEAQVFYDRCLAAGYAKDDLTIDSFDLDEEDSEE